MNQAIQLNPFCITTVPIQTYRNDFTFLVNGEIFKTSRLISDLLSPKICKIFITDPTIDQFCINTAQQGNFSRILDLINFSSIPIPMNELPFISEVIQILENETIMLFGEDNILQLTTDNVFSEIQKHENFDKFYFKRFQAEIEFIASHFYEIVEKHTEELKALKQETLEKIVNNEKLLLKDENQLLHFINVLYSENRKFSSLYETVYFERVTTEVLTEFVNVICLDDITNSSWKRLAQRLKQEISSIELSDDEKRYKNSIKIESKKRGTSFPFTEQNKFQGIISYLRTKSGGKITNEINFTASSNNNPNYQNYGHVESIAIFEDDSKCFWTQDIQDSWICLDFKDHLVIPTDYTIKTCCGTPYPKGWIIEASNDNNSWEQIDSQNNCSNLNGSNRSCSFKISKQNSKEYKYIRIRQTQSWGSNHLGIGSFEIFGTLI